MQQSTLVGVITPKYIYYFFTEHCNIMHSLNSNTPNVNNYTTKIKYNLNKLYIIIKIHV